MKKLSKPLKIVTILIAIGLITTFFIKGFTSGNRIDINSVKSITINDNDKLKTYVGQDAIDYLKSLNQQIKVIKREYRYYETARFELIEKKELTKRVTNYYSNITNKIIQQKIKFSVTQPWIINNDINTKQRETILKALGVEWANTYSFSTSVMANIPIKKNAYVKFYPVMNYSQGYLEEWYKCTNDSNINICLSKTKVETYSPSFIDKGTSRELNGVFEIVYEDLTK